MKTMWICYAVAFLPMGMHRLFRKRKIHFKCDEITIIKLLRQRSPYGVWRKACNLSSCLFRLLAILLVMELAHGSCTVFRYTVNCLKTHLKFLTFLSLYPPCIHFQLFCVSFVIVDIFHSVANGSICKTRTSIHCEITSQMPCSFYIFAAGTFAQLHFSFHFNAYKNCLRNAYRRKPPLKAGHSWILTSGALKNANWLNIHCQIKYNFPLFMRWIHDIWF